MSNSDVIDPYVPGARCWVNRKRDLFMDYDARPFIDQECVVLKRTKAGLIHVALASDPRKTYVVAQYNVDLL